MLWRPSSVVLALAIGFASPSCAWAVQAAKSEPVPTDDRLVPGDAERAGEIRAADVNESSGLAASGRYPGHYWTHNDNGGHAGLFLLDGSGKLCAVVDVPGIGFIDREAIATSRRDGRDWILVGDVGDNMARRENCQIHLLAEPELPAAGPDGVARTTVAEFRTLTFSYPDGPVNCEAMAVEPDGRIWLVSKQRPGGAGASNTGGRNGALDRAAIHCLEWPDPGAISQVATRIDSVFAPWLVTGMDIDRQGQFAVVRNPLSGWWFVRRPDETWSAAFARHPDRMILFPPQRQGESVCFDLERKHLYLSSEGQNQPFWRIELVPEASGDGDQPR